MKAALLLGAILLISLVMANEKSKRSAEENNKSSSEKKVAEPVSRIRIFGYFKKAGFYWREYVFVNEGCIS